MRFEFKPSFDRSIRYFKGKEKDELKNTAKQTITILTRGTKAYKGIGLKRLKEDYWEVRKGLKARILFKWTDDLVEFILAGDHNDIKRYLRNI